MTQPGAHDEAVDFDLNEFVWSTGPNVQRDIGRAKEIHKLCLKHG